MTSQPKLWKYVGGKCSLFVYHEESFSVTSNSIPSIKVFSKLFSELLLFILYLLAFASKILLLLSYFLFFVYTRIVSIMVPKY